MKYDCRTLLVTTLLGLSIAANAQDPGRQAPDKPASGTEAAPTAPQPADAGHWIRQLGSDSYRERLDAERKLRELGEAAIAPLEAAANGSKDGEVQWRARRLLRQLRNDGGLVERSREADRDRAITEQDPRGLQDDQGRREQMRDEFDRLFGRFERDFGIDIPRVRFFEDDFFRDLQEQMQAMRQGRSQGMSMSIGPNGVRVEVQEAGEDGKLETKVYEAPDMQSFREQYPDVLKENGLGLDLQMRPFGGLRGSLGPAVRGFDWHVGPQVVPFGGDRRADRDPLDPEVVPAAPLPPEGRRLGVVVRDLPPAVREYLDLGDGVGLMVGQVQEGTLAEALRLQPGDIVVKIGDVAIGSPADVQQALGGYDKGAEVVVEFVRKGQRQRATAEKRESGRIEAERSEPLRERGNEGKARSRGTIR